MQTKIFLILILTSSFTSGQLKQNQPRLMQNPTWNSYRVENDFGSTPILPTPSKNNLDNLEDDLIHLLEEDAIQLEKFIDNKIQNFEIIQTTLHNNTLEKIQDLRKRIKSIAPEQSCTAHDEETTSALKIFSTLDNFISEWDTYEWIKPGLEQIKSYRSSLTKQRSFRRSSFESDHCGGVVVEDFGEINFQAETNQSCIWTIRVSTTNVNLQLESDSIVKTRSLSITPTNVFGIFSLSYSGLPILTDSLLLKKDTNTRVEGPIIFITSNSSFSLKFEAIGEPEKNNNLQKYQHFHSTDIKGTFKYPTDSTAKYYSGPEIVTIVIQPQENNNPTKIHIEEIDIQEGLNDFIPDLTLFFGSKIIKSFYGCIQDNLNFFFLGLNKIKRFCGSMKDVELSEADNGEGIIVVFKSDILGDGKGFRFRWNDGE